MKANLDAISDLMEDTAHTTTTTTETETRSTYHT